MELWTEEVGVTFRPAAKTPLSFPPSLPPWMQRIQRRSPRAERRAKPHDKRNLVCWTNQRNSSLHPTMTHTRLWHEQNIKLYCVKLIFFCIVYCSSITYFGQPKGYYGANGEYLDLEINIPLVSMWFSNFNVHKNHLGEYVKAVFWVPSTEILL